MMTDRLKAALDALAGLLEHRVFGLLVWVGIAVFQDYQDKQDFINASVAGLIVLKTYLSGTWERKKNGNGNAQTPPTQPTG